MRRSGHGTRPGAPDGTCPSTTGGTPGSAIIGFIGPSGRVAPIPTPIPLSPALRATLGGQPERVFRLAAPCAAAACAQWDGRGCGLIGSLRTALADVPPSPTVQCGIRASCVWFREAGLEACQVCPSVTYNPHA